MYYNPQDCLATNIVIMQLYNIYICRHLNKRTAFSIYRLFQSSPCNIDYMSLGYVVIQHGNFSRLLLNIVTLNVHVALTSME